MHALSASVVKIRQRTLQPQASSLPSRIIKHGLYIKKLATFHIHDGGVQVRNLHSTPKKKEILANNFRPWDDAKNMIYKCLIS
jgi:hypothetical protein